MKIQLDTDKKIIKIDEIVVFKELIKVLNKLLPKGEWKDFKLETNTVINWNTYPIITYPIYPVYPDSNPTYTIRPWIIYCGEVDHIGNYELKSGIFNIETQI